MLPLLLQEVEHVYYVTHVRNTRAGAGPPTPSPPSTPRRARAGRDRGGLLASAGLGHVPPVDLDALARPFGDEQFGSPEEFRERLLKVMDDDLAAAALGTLDGP